MKTIILSASAIVIAGAVMLFASCSGSDDSPTASPSSNVLDGYLEISEALFNDDLATAKAAAAKVASKRNSPLAEPAGAIAAAETIEVARANFVLLSKEAVNLAADESEFHIASCPMVEDGLWVQRGTSIRNPYMGQKMPTCGTLKR